MKKPIYLATATLLMAGATVASTYRKPSAHNSSQTVPTASVQPDPIQPSNQAAAASPSAAPAPTTPADQAPTSAAPAASSPAVQTPASQSASTAPATPTPTVIGESLRYQDSTTQPNTQDAYCTYRFDDASQVDKYVGSRPTPSDHQAKIELECPSWRG